MKSESGSLAKIVSALRADEKHSAAKFQGFSTLVIIEKIAKALGVISDEFLK